MASSSVSSPSTLPVGDGLGSAPTETPTAAATTSALATNAVTRTFSDLHAPTWLMLLSANISARTLLFHPIQLAISRKRVTRESKPPTVLGLIKASYRGGRTSAYGPGCSAAQYNFGQGGIRGCYRGVGAALLCNLLGETSYLFTLEAMKEYVERTRDTTSTTPAEGTDSAAAAAAGRGSSTYAEENIFAASSYSAAVGAMCGDLVALLLVSPLVIVCNRQMTAGYSMASTNAYSTIPQTLRNVWGLHQKKPPSAAGAAAVAAPAPPAHRLDRVRRGFGGLYQGLSAGLLRIPSSGCWWGLYTKSKEALYTVAAPTLAAWEQESREGPATATRQSMWQHNWLLSPTDNPLLNALAGIAASTCTTLLFNPIAVIQTRQQALPPRFWQERALGSAAAVAQRRTWRSSLPFRRVYHVADDLVRKEGVRGFFKGAPANVSVAVLDGVIFTLLFEFTKLGSDMRFLEKLHTE